jgi:hypothetical protein
MKMGWLAYLNRRSTGLIRSDLWSEILQHFSRFDDFTPNILATYVGIISVFILPFRPSARPMSAIIIKYVPLFDSSFCGIYTVSDDFVYIAGAS